MRSPICIPSVCLNLACCSCPFFCFAWAVHVLCPAKKPEADDGTDAMEQLSVVTVEKRLLGGRRERETRRAASAAMRDVRLASRSASLFWEGRACICPQLAWHRSSSSLGLPDHLPPTGEGAKPPLLAGSAITQGGGRRLFPSTTWCPRCGWQDNDAPHRTDGPSSVPAVRSYP